MACHGMESSCKTEYFARLHAMQAPDEQKQKKKNTSIDRAFDDA